MDELFSRIGEHISAACGKPLVIEAKSAVAGGSIHRSWEISGSGQHYFVKLNTREALPMFTAEAADLAALATAVALRVPQVICRGSTDTHAYLVLEHLALKPLAPASGAALGHALANLHRNVGGEFGWPQDNFIGATPQCNASCANWPLFFAERRLKPQLALQGQHPLPRPLRDEGEALAERVSAFFVTHTPVPSLLHGDLWSGNAACLGDGTPVIFDPAAYRGDRETDLAMAELFGGFPEDFYAAYREAWPLDDGFETRKTLYNLYHILNHYHLFGPGYLSQARRMIGHLRAELRA